MGFPVDNIRRACSVAGITLAELERELKIGNGVIARWEKNKGSPPHDRLAQIAARFGMTVDELANPNATPWDIAASIAKNAPGITEDVVTFEVVGDVAAGYDHIATQDWDGEKIDVPRAWLHGRPQSDFFALRVKGDSMYPLYMDGDVVLVLRQETMNRSGEIGVVIYGDENATLKRVDYVMGEDWMKLTPINPNFPPVMIRDEELEHCKVLGFPVKLIRDIVQ